MYVLSQYLMINSYLVYKSARTMLICTGRSKLMDEIIVNYSFNNVMEKIRVFIHNYYINNVRNDNLYHNICRFV
jgi:hypothetical protein